MLGTIGFWQLGKTDVAKAFVFPTLITGVLLLIIGFGLYFSNKSRLGSFEAEYNADPIEFVKSEINRADKTLQEYQTIVFKVIPLIIVFSALLFVFVDKPIWRATCIMTIAMMVVLMLVDSNAHVRIKSYKEQLTEAIQP